MKKLIFVSLLILISQSRFASSSTIMSVSLAGEAISSIDCNLKPLVCDFILSHTDNPEEKQEKETSSDDDSSDEVTHPFCKKNPGACQ